MAFRLIRHALPDEGGSRGRNVLIYGAGDGGEMVLRELKNNPAWEYKPIGFIDDDPNKKGKVVHGLTVFDGKLPLSRLCEEKHVTEILISARGLPPERLKELRDVCGSAGVELKRAYIKIEPVDFA